LAKAVKGNTSLQIFDASFNTFGSGPMRQKKNLPRRGS